MTNIPPSSHGMTGWRKRLADRREARLLKEAEAAKASEARNKVRQDRRDYAARKAAGLIPNPTALSSVDDSGGYDMNGNPL
jgi:uncharacterized membrane-anchored protein YhcB (DUF1043 family)